MDLLNNIIGKAAPVKEQTVYAVKGFKKQEIQLLPDFVNKVSVKETYNIIKESGAEVK